MIEYLKKNLGIEQREAQALDGYLEMLTYKRPSGSLTEEEWVEDFISPLAGCVDVREFGEDKAGNRWFMVGEDPGGTMFTAHTDSVHRTEGYQVVFVTDGIARLHPNPYASPETPSETPPEPPSASSPETPFEAPWGDAKVNFAAELAELAEQPPIAPKDSWEVPRLECLGADDASGCWILSEMIRAGIPGFYVFFRDEEVGGLGSRWMAENPPFPLEDFKRCVSFDRRGTDSVITHQARGRCCSDDFAAELAEQLSIAGERDSLLFGPDDTGLFTDSANFTDVIPECTNISVGYDGEHGPGETQDLVHLLALSRAVMKVDWANLPTLRDPSEVDDFHGQWQDVHKWSMEGGKYEDYGYGYGYIDSLSPDDILAMDSHELLMLVENSDPIEIVQKLQELAQDVFDRETYYH